MGTLRLSKRESKTNRNKNGWCNENHSGLDPGLFPCGSLVFPRIQQSSPKKSYLLAATALHLRGPHSSLPLLISCPGLLSLWPSERILEARNCSSSGDLGSRAVFSGDLGDAGRAHGQAAPVDLPGDGASDPDTQLAKQTVYNVCLTLI